MPYRDQEYIEWASDALQAADEEAAWRAAHDAGRAEMMRRYGAERAAVEAGFPDGQEWRRERARLEWIAQLAVERQEAAEAQEDAA